MTTVYKIFQQDMDLKGLLEVAGVDTTKGKAKKLLIRENIEENDSPYDIYDDMMDDLSVQTLVQDINALRKKGLSWKKIEANYDEIEKEAQTELTAEEKEALFFVLKDVTTRKVAGKK